jgi:hypothetical protein
MAKKQFIEPGEEIYNEITDPLMTAPTVDRDYTRPAPGNGANIDPNNPLQDIPEPVIQPPNMDDDSDRFEDADIDGDSDGDSGIYDFETDENHKKGKPKKETDDDSDYEGFDFKMNGEAALYILDFIYKMFKDRYKITPEMFEKHGLDQAVMKMRLKDERGRLVSVGDLSDRINALMDEVEISNDDKKYLKKLIVNVTKKHDVKMSEEAQLLMIVGKIGFETHIQLKQLQMSVIEMITGHTVLGSGVDDATKTKAPDPDQVADFMAGTETDDSQGDVTEIFNDENSNAESKKKKQRNNKLIDGFDNITSQKNIHEPGED